jgi:hypothetical protein
MSSNERIFLEAKRYMIVLSKGEKAEYIKTPVVVKEIREALKRLGFGPGQYHATLAVE